MFGESPHFPWREYSPLQNWIPSFEVHVPWLCKIDDHTAALHMLTPSWWQLRKRQVDWPSMCCPRANLRLANPTLGSVGSETSLGRGQFFYPLLKRWVNPKMDSCIHFWLLFSSSQYILAVTFAISPPASQIGTHTAFCAKCPNVFFSKMWIWKSSGGLVGSEDWALSAAKLTTFSSRGGLCWFHVGCNHATHGLKLHVILCIHYRGALIGRKGNTSHAN